MRIEALICPCGKNAVHRLTLDDGEPVGHYCRTCATKKIAQVAREEAERARQESPS